MYWWEIDISHYTLRFLSLFGLVWDIRTHPERLYEEAISLEATPATNAVTN
jgi:stearoyl-CoA desaturase (delta-9 desaturase)